MAASDSRDKIGRDAAAGRVHIGTGRAADVCLRYLLLLLHSVLLTLTVRLLPPVETTATMCCAGALPTLLLQINLMLMIFAGAALTTAARLKWDPSLYVPARELFPLEYRVLAAALPGAALALLLQAHLALLALRCRRPRARRNLLLVYAACMLLMVVGEVVSGAWVAVRVHSWLHSAQADELAHALQLQDHLRPLLEHLAYFHPLPQKLNHIIQEAQEDAPRYGRVCAGAGLALLALQLAALALALAAASLPVRRRLAQSVIDTNTTTTPISVRRGDGERAPLRAVYKQGRLVMV